MTASSLSRFLILSWFTWLDWKITAIPRARSLNSEAKRSIININNFQSSLLTTWNKNNHHTFSVLTIVDYYSCLLWHLTGNIFYLRTLISTGFISCTIGLESLQREIPQSNNSDSQFCHQPRSYNEQESSLLVLRYLVLGNQTHLHK